MIAQQGEFTVGYHIHTNHEAAIESACATQSGAFGRAIIPKDKKPDFLRKLHAMNVAASSVFPGVDGVGRSVNEMVRMRICFPCPKDSFTQQPPKPHPA
jgi:hypothetical protein